MKGFLITGLGLLGLMPSFALAANTECQQIEAAMSASEDFTEAALGGTPAEQKDFLVAIHRNVAAIEPKLQMKAAEDVKAGISTIETTFTSGDLPHTAVAATVVYKTLANAFHDRLPSTLDVAMLDYDGFKLRALAAAVPPDWNEIKTAITETGVYWKNASRQAKSAALDDLMKDTLLSLEQATTASNLAWIDASAKILLDTVDLAETAVKSQSKAACR